ncbi:MAG: hypothetical protein SOT07_06440 [Paludibacteraceae bacterium]|nr:hypothetical protein [Paludibacteraceae bacterium]
MYHLRTRTGIADSMLLGCSFSTSSLLHHYSFTTPSLLFRYYSTFAHPSLILRPHLLVVVLHTSKSADLELLIHKSRPSHCL